MRDTRPRYGFPLPRQDLRPVDSGRPTPRRSHTTRARWLLSRASASGTTPRSVPAAIGSSTGWWPTGGRGGISPSAGGRTRLAESPREACRSGGDRRRACLLPATDDGGCRFAGRRPYGSGRLERPAAVQGGRASVPSRRRLPAFPAASPARAPAGDAARGESFVWARISIATERRVCCPGPDPYGIMWPCSCPGIVRSARANIKTPVPTRSAATSRVL